MLVATRLTWVTVAKSTQSGDRHHLGSPRVAVFGVWVWVLGIGLQKGWRSWVAQCTSAGGHRMWVVVTRLGWLGTLWTTLVLDISFLSPCQVRTLPGCLLPNCYPILPHERMSAQTRGIVPHVHF